MRNSSAERRERRLGSDVEAGRHARRHVRLIHRQVLREHPRLWLLILLGAAAITIPVALVQRNAFLQGAVVGGMSALAAAGIGFLVVLNGGTAPLMMGEVAEQWTAQSLRPLLKHGWHLANHVLLNSGDADHVLVGPGGVIVVETKWRREPWRTHDADRDAALRQVQANANSIRLLVGRHVEVQPVIVLWTSAVAKRPEPATERRYGDVVVVPGSALQPWALRRPRNVFDEAQVAVLWGSLSHHKLRNVEFERMQRPIPMSFENLALGALGLVLLGCLGLLASSWTLTLAQSVPAWIGASVLVATARWRVRRDARLHWPITAFAVGWALSLVLVAVALMSQVIT